MRFLAAVAVATLVLCSAASAVTLEFWHAWPDNAQTIQYLASRYAQQTGVQVHIRVVSPTPRMSWGAYDGPDLAGLADPTYLDIQAMAGRGLIQDIKVEISRGWYALLWPALLGNFDIRGSRGSGIYGVPLTGEVHVFVYNRTLFSRAGIRPPRTWNELMSISRRLRKIGVTPYAGGFSSNRPALAAAYENAYLGRYVLAETYSGHYPYTASQWVAYLKLYTEMRQNGFTTAAAAKMSETSAMKALIDGRVAMVFANQEFESVRRSYKPSFNAWGVFDAPDDARSRFRTKLPGGVVEGLVFNSRSGHKAQAIHFARWLTSYDQQLALARGSGSIPAMTVASNSAQLSAPLRPFAIVGMRQLTADLRIFERPAVLSTFYSGVLGILSGTSTPSATARRTQLVKARR